jgi:hypothetical protein
MLVIKSALAMSLSIEYESTILATIWILLLSILNFNWSICCILVWFVVLLWYRPIVEDYRTWVVGSKWGFWRCWLYLAFLRRNINFWLNLH